MNVSSARTVSNSGQNSSEVKNEHSHDLLSLDELLTEEELAVRDNTRSFLQERIARYKYPRRVKFMDELPKNAIGKILKRELIEVGQEAMS